MDGSCRGDYRSNLSWIRLAIALTGALLVSFAIGLYPTWRLAGVVGIESALIAGCIDLLLLLASGALVCWSARSFGPTRTAQVFLVAGMGRMFLLVVLGLLATWLLSLPVVAYGLWAAAVYLPMLMAEVIWAGRGFAVAAKLQGGVRA